MNYYELKALCYMVKAAGFTPMQFQTLTAGMSNNEKLVYIENACDNKRCERLCK